MLRLKVAMNYVACFIMNSVCWYFNMKANKNLINRQVLYIWATNIGYDWLESWIMSGERWNEILIWISSLYRGINMAITWLNNNSLKTITRHGISLVLFYSFVDSWSHVIGYADSIETWCGQSSPPSMYLVFLRLISWTLQNFLRIPCRWTEGWIRIHVDIQVQKFRATGPKARI